MNRVVILGAGASAGFENGESETKPPVTRTIFDKALELEDEGELSLCNFRSLDCFLSKYYHRNLRNASGLDVEEVLTLIDLAKNKNAQRDMLRLIADVLDKTLFGDPCEHHRTLWDNLGNGDTIINFNWDLLLENNMISSESGHIPNYGTRPNVLRVTGTGFAGDSEIKQLPQLLKLHGSFNWMYCKQCKKVHARLGGGKTNVKILHGARETCDVCKNDTKPLIIPPTLLKSYENPVLKEVWNLAKAALRSASEITVVGYSMPPTDFNAKWLFMDGTVNNRDRSIMIFDKEAKGLREKFAAAFHMESARIKCTKGGIKEAAAWVAGDNDRRSG